MQTKEDRQVQAATALSVMGLVYASLIIVSTFALWGLSLFYWGQGEDDFSVSGTFGDSFGPVTALFSALAFVAVAYGLYQTQQSIRIQRADFTASLDEQKQSVAEQKTQNEYLLKQAARQQFFQMLNSWQELTTAFRHQADTTLVGREAIKHFSDKLAKNICDGIRNMSILPVDESPLLPEDPRTLNPRWVRQATEATFDTFEADNSFMTGHYFRLLYHMVRFVDKNAVFSTDERKDLIRILRAHLSNAEFTLLFYNGILPRADQLYPYIEDYQLLHNMPLTSILGHPQFCGIEAVTLLQQFYPKNFERHTMEAKRQKQLTLQMNESDAHSFMVAAPHDRSHSDNSTT